MPSPYRPFGVCRTIVESNRYSAEKAKIEPDARCLDDALDGVTFVICRHPEFGAETDALGVMAATTASLLGVPALVLYYRYTDNEVTLLSVVRADEESVPD